MCEEQYVDRIRQSGAPVEHLVCIDGRPEGTITVEELAGLGSPDFDFEAAWRAVQPDDVLTLIYTSGTTGAPKGVEMTHASLLFEAYALAEVLPVEFGDRGTSYLPTAHIADRMLALYLQEVMGTQLTVVPDARQIAAALPDCRPTIWGAVPRVWEKLRAGILASVAAEPDETRRQGLQWALGVAEAKAQADLSGSPLPADLAVQYARADELVLSGLRAKLGLDQVKWAISGAAPIPARGPGVLQRAGHPGHGGLGHVRAELHRQRGAAGRAPAGHGGQAAARDGRQDRRGRGVPGPRAAGDEGLPPGTGQDRRGRRGRLAAHRRRDDHGRPTATSPSSTARRSSSSTPPARTCPRRTSRTS